MTPSVNQGGNTKTCTDCNGTGIAHQSIFACDLCLKCGATGTIGEDVKE